MKKTLLLFSIILLITACKSPELTTKKYAEYSKSGDCESLILITTNEALRTVVNTECKAYETKDISEVNCEIGKSTATCIYTENRSFYSLNTEIETTLKLVKLNKDWKVSNSEIKISKMTGGNDPKIVADVFINLLSEANFDIAKTLTISDAKSKINHAIEKQKEPFHLEIISKTVEINGNSAVCKTIEKRNYNKEIKYYYELVRVGDEWRISNYYLDVAGSPQTATQAFVISLSKGECGDALEMTTGTAHETVIGTIEGGCEPYNSEIVEEIKCEVEGDKAVCACTEKRDILGEMTFEYNLVRIDNQWKISEYSKDMDYIEDEE